MILMQIYLWCHIQINNVKNVYINRDVTVFKTIYIVL